MTDCNPLSICIISHNAYGVLAGVDTGHSGGIEVQASIMAKWLVKHGYRVSIITWDEGVDDRDEVDGVKVIRLCRRDAGVRIVRFFYPRWSSFNAAMAKADADVYYYNCGDLGLGQLVAWAHYNNKCVVYSVASEQDCYNDLSHLTSLRDRYMYKYGLKRADHIIVQTKIQKELLGREYGLDSTVIPMPCDWDVDESILSSQRLGHEPKRILWVGRINKEKRLEWLLDLARACPDLIFDVIGDENTPSDYGRGLMAEADSIPNVNMHGRVPRDKMVAFYQSASLLCSTSIYEGFPNVYLEAWSTGLPIVSTFDPDGVIQENGIGKVAEDQQALIVAIRTMLEPEQHQMASNSAKQYFTNHHAIESSMKEFARVFEIANRSRA